MVRIPQTLEDLKSYSTFLSILPSDADSKATAEEKKRIMALQRPFYEAYKSHCRRTGQAIIPPENFRIDMLLKLCAGERNFEFFDPHTITDPKRALLRHYSALSDGTFIPNERGEFVAIVDSSTGDKRFVHYSQVYGLESYVLPLLDILNIALAISFQTMNLSIAMMNDYMTETENINLEIERLAKLYHQLAVGSINSTAFPEKPAKGEATMRIFVQMDKATVRAMQELGVGLKDQYVVIGARVKPIFAHWREYWAGSISHDQQAHWQWHMPIIDGKSGKLYKKTIRILGGDDETDEDTGYPLADRKASCALLLSTLKDYPKRYAADLEKTFRSIDYRINSKYLDSTGQDFSKEVIDAMEGGKTLYNFIKEHRGDFFATNSAAKADGLETETYVIKDPQTNKVLEERTEVKVNLFDYQNPVFPVTDFTAKDIDLLGYLNQQPKVRCEYQTNKWPSGWWNGGCADLPGDHIGDGPNAFVKRAAILPTHPDRYVWIDDADVQKHGLDVSAQAAAGETISATKKSGSNKNDYGEGGRIEKRSLEPVVNTGDATVKKKLSEMLNDPELDICYVEVDDITSAQEVLRQDIDRLTTDMQVPSNTVSHENNTLQMILQLASNIVANIGDQMTKTNGNIRI